MGGPAVFDCASGALSAVDYGDQGCLDALDKKLVVVGSFMFAPVPGDDMVYVGGDD